MAIAVNSPERPLRPALPEQLRHDPAQGRAGPAAGRGRREHARPARLQHAGLARPREAGRPEHDGRRRGPRPPRAEHAGRRRPDRPAARRRRARRSRSRSSTLGRLTEAEQFEDDHRQVDAATGGSCASRTWPASSWAPRTRTSAPAVDGSPSVSLAIFLLPDANALETADLRQGQDGGAEDRTSPPACDYAIALRHHAVHPRVDPRGLQDPPDAIVLVAIVVLLFLQNWRSALIPLVAVPVAIVGTFAVMALLGFSAQQPDAVRAGAGDRHRGRRRDRRRRGRRAPHRAGPGPARRHRQGDGRGDRPVIAIGAGPDAPCSSPAPSSRGITGQFFRQFALTIAVSTLISAFNSLTLRPALAALLLKPRRARPEGGGPPKGRVRTGRGITRHISTSLRGSSPGRGVPVLGGTRGTAGIDGVVGGDRRVRGARRRSGMGRRSLLDRLLSGFSGSSTRGSGRRRTSTAKPSAGCSA